MLYNVDLWAIVVACIIALSVTMVHFVLHPQRRFIMLAYTISLMMLLIAYGNQLFPLFPHEVARLMARFGVLSLVCNIWAQYLPEVHHDVWKRIYDYIYKRVHTWNQRL